MPVESQNFGNLFFWRCVMSQQSLLDDLANKSLQGWTVRRVVEVYSVDDDGRYAKNLAWFASPDLAEAFKDQQPDSAYHRTDECWALMNDELKQGIAFGNDSENIKLMDEVEVRKGVRAKAMEKLTPAERKALMGDE